MDPRLEQGVVDAGALSPVGPRYLQAADLPVAADQAQTREAFSAKWKETDHGSPDFERSLARQKRWYLELYGFESEAALATYLQGCELVLDAGAGKAGKAAWFAQLAPETCVVAADISDSLQAASEYYADVPNLLFVRCDIGSMPCFGDARFDYVSCDQVIHHTADPPATFRELVRLTAPGRDVSTYVYRAKALPRELLDDHFRTFSKQCTHDELMALSQQLTTLGKLLSEDAREYEFPAIPLLGIEGGPQTVQRFLYWNFLKCFWNPELGEHVSTMTNYDWYAPSQAERYSEAAFRGWVEGAGLQTLHFHAEPACYSGRFRTPG